MLRTAQSMLAHAWQRQLQGDAWFDKNTAMPAVEANIAHWIADLRCAESVYGIHAAALVAQSLQGLAPGEWYGPMAVASVLEALNTLHAMRDGASMLVHVVTDACLCCDHVHQLCAGSVLSPPAAAPQGDSKEQQTGAAAAATDIPLLSARPPRWLRSALLLVPLRLGLGQLNEEYRRPLLRVMQLPQSVGFIGGTPRHSLYFVGARGAAADISLPSSGGATPLTSPVQLMYLDPHTTQAPPLTRSLSHPALIRKAASAPRGAAGMPVSSSALSGAAAEASAGGFCTSSGGALPEADTWGAGVLRSVSSKTAALPVTSPNSGETEFGSRLARRFGRYWPHLEAAAALPSLPSDTVLREGFQRSLHAPARAVGWADIRGLDPSLALGFHCREGGDFTALVGALRAIQRECGVELFAIYDETPAYMAGEGSHPGLVGSMSDSFWEGDRPAAAAAQGGALSPAAAHPMSAAGPHHHDCVLVEEPRVSAAGEDLHAECDSRKDEYILL